MNEITSTTPVGILGKHRISDATAECFDKNGNSVGMTGGAIAYGKTVGSCITGYARKAKGMIKRGYFAGAVTVKVQLTIWDGVTRSKFESSLITL